MVTSKREQYIAVALGLVVGGAIVLNWIIWPMIDQNAALHQQIIDEDISLRNDKNLIAKIPQNLRTWTTDLDVIKHDQSEAQSQVLNMLGDWRDAARLGLNTIQPVATPQAVNKPSGKVGEKEKAFMRLTCRLAGQGGMQQVSNFIWQIQTSDIPVRISDLQITTKKEDTDQLEVSLGVTTIFLTADALKTTAGSGAPAANSGGSSATTTTESGRNRGRGNRSRLQNEAGSATQPSNRRNEAGATPSTTPAAAIRATAPAAVIPSATPAAVNSAVLVPATSSPATSATEVRQ